MTEGKTTTFDNKDGRDWLKGLLVQGVAEVKFEKADGTKRLMKCTLSSDIIPTKFFPKETELTESKRKVNEKVLAVFDVEKQGWRSFKLDSIISVSFDTATAKYILPK